MSEISSIREKILKERKKLSGEADKEISLENLRKKLREVNVQQYTLRKSLDEYVEKAIAGDDSMIEKAEETDLDLQCLERVELETIQLIQDLNKF